MGHAIHAHINVKTTGSDSLSLMDDTEVKGASYNSINKLFIVFTWIGDDFSDATGMTASMTNSSIMNGACGMIREELYDGA